MTTDEQRTVALAALHLARPRQFEALRLHGQGLTQAAIAAQLGVTQGRVSQLLKQAASNLEKVRARINTGKADKHNNS